MTNMGEIKTKWREWKIHVYKIMMIDKAEVVYD
jgi:hypothetical protein